MVPYLEQFFTEFSPLLNRQIKNTRVCMQANQLDLCRELGIRPCVYRKSRGFVDTSTDSKILHCSRVCDAGNLYQCDKINRNLSETFGGLIPYEFGVPSASTLLGCFFAGCSDKPKYLREALDEDAWELWHQLSWKFKHNGGEEWTLKCVRETGIRVYVLLSPS